MKKILTAIAVAAACTATAQAQTFPKKPITMVVPFPAGGSSDMVARMIGPQMSEKLGQPVIIENRPGATGAIGGGVVRRAPPDGHTLLLASIGVYATNPFLQKNLPYDPQKDFDLLGVAVRAPNVLVVHPAMAAKSVSDLIAFMKKSPGKVTFASSGVGSSDHLTAALFWQRTETSGLHVPYKGGAPAIADLLGGHADASFQNLNAVLPYIRSGKLRALAVTSEKRVAQLPQVPAMAEAGVKDVVVYSWQAAAAPRGLPKDVRAALHGAIADALNEPATRKKMTEMGFEVVASTPEEFEKFLAQELARWGKVIKAGNISLE